MTTPPSFARWMRHTSVPKGLLQLYVLRLLNESPKSGSEIIEAIHEETGGHWKPSPGSIYPLLAWMQENGYAKRLPAEQGKKPYTLTAQGQAFLRKQMRFGEKLRKKLEFLAPVLVGGFPLGRNTGKQAKIRRPARRLIMALLRLRMLLKDDLRTQTLEEVAGILNESAARIEEIIERIQTE